MVSAGGSDPTDTVLVTRVKMGPRAPRHPEAQHLKATMSMSTSMSVSVSMSMSVSPKS